ncbi:MAG TPA: hypothetical protein DEB10_07850 [Ruminococcaceae bacterium]|nr:hypothetical protein [Oscillospiraceae bacterium]
MGKKFIDVTAHFDTEGKIIPVMFWWEDGKSYQIDRVLDIRRSASLKAGGIGIRYTCRILGKNRYLYYDDYTSKWFVEVPDDFRTTSI